MAVASNVRVEFPPDPTHVVAFRALLLSGNTSTTTAAPGAKPFPPLSNTTQAIMLTVAAMFFSLFLMSLGRLFQKYCCCCVSAAGGCNCSGSRDRLITVAMLLLVCVYAAARVVELCLNALGVVSDGDDLSAHCFTFIPAALFLVLQTVLMVKWERHVRTLTLQVRNAPFRVGAILIWTSVVLSVATSLVTIIAAADLYQHFAPMDENAWNHALSATTGASFVYNGLAFAALGLLLSRMWRPTRVESQRAARRVLLIAGLFGALCVVRGLLLMSFFLDGTKPLGSAYKARVSGPIVLGVECLLLMLIGYLFMAPASAASSTAATSGYESFDESTWIPGGGGLGQRDTALRSGPAYSGTEETSRHFVDPSVTTESRPRTVNFMTPDLDGMNSQRDFLPANGDSAGGGGGGHGASWQISERGVRTVQQSLDARYYHTHQATAPH